MEKEFKRSIVVFEEHFKEFRKTLPRNDLKKLYQVLEYIMIVDIIPVRFLKQIEGVEDLFEIRIEAGNNSYRIFCCFDKGNLVILFNAYHKKSQRTSAMQIRKAKVLMKRYFEQKAQNK